MATGSDATHIAGTNYTVQGSTRTVIEGELDLVSGGSLNLESGADMSFASGSYFTFPVQALGTSQVGTNITNFGITTITASTTGPAYTLAAPVAGVMKVIACTANTSSGTATVNTNSTGVSVSSSGTNALTFNSIADRAVLFATSTSAWVLGAVHGSTDVGVALATQST